MKIQNKIAIGCIVQWYEIEIANEYVDSLLQALEVIDNKENITVDFCFYLTENLEQVDTEQITMGEILNRCREIERKLIDIGVNPIIDYYTNDEIYTIANYRRDFNDKYCTEVDILMWGETDSLIPRQTFQILDMLYTKNVSQKVYKWVAFFGGCKMWDDSWKIIEHTDFTDKPFIEGDTENWWSLRYVMNINEMNKFNDKVEELDVRVANPYKFNGCGLVISSDVVKSGVNIPRSMMLVHEDTAFQNSLIKTFNGSIPQFVIKNILLVHNRKHPRKRMYVLGEKSTGNNFHDHRKDHDWYNKIWKADHHNCNTMFNQEKVYKWGDVIDE